ncbi:hypothetical protein JXL19_01785 [bacterium]|nr:hypothetical protein [bacterium]
MHMSRFWFKLLLVCIVVIFSFSLTVFSYAQNLLYNPWISYARYPFWQSFPPATYYPSFTVAYAPWISPYIPALSPINFSMPVAPSVNLPRVGAATVITIPTTNTVTTSAPLGTLNLTPSTLVFLILLFTLH